jgi:glycine/D-amino acid oxidase-like deaminating enzyme
LRSIIGIPATIVNREDQSAEVGSDRYHDGIVYQRDGNLQPALLLQGMARTALAAGAQVFSPAKVLSVSRPRWLRLNHGQADNLQEYVPYLRRSVVRLFP